MSVLRLIKAFFREKGNEISRKVARFGLGDINNSISMPNYCDGPYLDLDIYTKKVSSPWTEVWSDTCLSTASIIPQTPGGATWKILKILCGACDIHNSISRPNYYHTCLP